MKMTDTIKLLDKHCPIVTKNIPIPDYGYVTKKMWLIPGVNYYITHDFHYDTYSKKWQEFVFIEAPFLNHKRTQSEYLKSVQSILKKIDIYKSSLPKVTNELPDRVVKKV